MPSFNDLIFGKTENPEMLSMGTLTPAQKAVMTGLQGKLTTGLDEGVQSYGGQTVAGMSPYETQALDSLSAGGQTPYAGDTSSAYMRYLSGDPTSNIDSSTTEQYYQDVIAQPAMRQFKEEFAPALSEEFIGSNMYNSDARARALQKSSSDLQSNLMSQRSNLFYQDEQAKRNLKESAANRALEAGGQLSNMGQFERSQKLAETQALSQMGQVPRLLEQAGLDWNYQEFLRTSPESSPYLQMAMQFLGIPMMATGLAQGFYQPGLLQEGVKAATSMATGGAMQKGGGGGSSDTAETST